MEDGMEVALEAEIAREQTLLSSLAEPMNIWFHPREPRVLDFKI